MAQIENLARKEGAVSFYYLLKFKLKSSIVKISSSICFKSFIETPETSENDYRLLV